MEKLQKISLEKKELVGLPLYFHKIYYNPIVDTFDEEKCYYYSRQAQSIVVKNEDPSSDIAKIINFNDYEDHFKR